MKILKPITLSVALMAAPVSFAYGQSSGVNVADVQSKINLWKVTGLPSGASSGLSTAAQRGADGVSRVRVVGIESVRVDGSVHLVRARVEVDTSGVEYPSGVKTYFYMRPDKNMAKDNGYANLALSNHRFTGGTNPGIQSFVTDELRFVVDWKRAKNYSTTADKVKLVGMVTSIGNSSGRAMTIANSSDYLPYHKSQQQQSAKPALPTMCNFAIKEGEALIAYHNAYTAAGGSYNRAKPQASNYERGDEHCKANESSAGNSGSSGSTSSGWGTVKPKSSTPRASAWDTAAASPRVAIPGADAPLSVRMERAFNDISLGAVRTFKLQSSRSRPTQATIRTNFTGNISNVPTVKPIRNISYGLAVYPIGRPELAEIVSSRTSGSITGSNHQLKTTRADTTRIQLAGNFDEINIPTEKSAYEFRPFVFSYNFKDGSKLVLMPSKDDAKAYLRK